MTFTTLTLPVVDLHLHLGHIEYVTHALPRLSLTVNIGGSGALPRIKALVSQGKAFGDHIVVIHCSGSLSLPFVALRRPDEWHCRSWRSGGSPPKGRCSVRESCRWRRGVSFPAAYLPGLWKRSSTCLCRRPVRSPPSSHRRLRHCQDSVPPPRETGPHSSSSHPQNPPPMPTPRLFSAVDSLFAFLIALVYRGRSFSKHHRIGVTIQLLAPVCLVAFPPGIQEPEFERVHVEFFRHHVYQDLGCYRHFSARPGL